MIHFVRKRISALDVASWVLVILFFGFATFLFKGLLAETLTGAVGIVSLMLVVTLSISVILDVMRNHPRLGELSGYITNGPEALCVLVGLLHHKLMFAVSVPLGSNFANPILLALAVLLAHRGPSLFHRRAMFAGLTMFVTLLAAGIFYVSDAPSYRWGWVGLVFVATLFLYGMKGQENSPPEEEDEIELVHPFLLIPAILCLVAAGYFLDPVIAYTAGSSKLPEGAIGFLVLSFLTSWPEFRCALALLHRKRARSAFMNAYVSNLTNLWLAIAGTLIYLLTAGGR